MEFFIQLPLILMEMKISLNSNILELYVLLRKICSIILSQCLKVETLKKLNNYTEVYSTRFKKVFPEESITLKMHYLTHYSKLIESYGPLVKFSSIRFERKHSYFNTLAQKIKNFRNITLSLSKRHQRLAAIVYIHEKFFSLDETDYINEIDIDFKIRNITTK
jgi:hypothetical protein